MGRRPQPEVRERLLARCTDAVLADGLPSGLAPLSAATGTSPRMLLYHFGTRDALLREVLREARGRQLALFGGALAPTQEPYAHTLRRAWAVMTGPEGAPFLRLFTALNADPHELWPGFRRVATTDWLDVLARGLAEGGGDTGLATTVLAVVRGLLQDRAATGDVERTEAAFEAFVRLLGEPG